jgi:hypothetical protein
MLAMWNEIDAINSEKALVKFLHREDIRVAYLGDKYTKAMLINSTDQYGVVAFILKELRKEL